MSGPEILLILVSILAAGRVVAFLRDTEPAEVLRSRTDIPHLVGTALLVMAGFYGVVGLIVLVAWGVSLVGLWKPANSNLTEVAGACFLLAEIFGWLGIRIYRGDGIARVVARVARVACREVSMPRTLRRKSKSTAASPLLD